MSQVMAAADRLSHSHDKRYQATTKNLSQKRFDQFHTNKSAVENTFALSCVTPRARNWAGYQ